MSITGSLLTYENNNQINKSKKHASSTLSSRANCLSKTPSSSLNFNTVFTDSSGNHKHHQTRSNFQRPYFPTNYMNSKRKHPKYNSMHSQIYPDNNNYLHLNSLWSIWYGVLLTLFQGYLAVHGAFRFLGCSLIPWKIEPVAELNLQIIFSGLVFVLLPFFFTSAVFKVGNLSNDGIKLGFAKKGRRWSMVSHDGLEEESRSNTFRTLWTHGGPTAAFIHLLIAMCLLLPRLLLEGRIIENGLLPREAIWQTELDFVTLSRRNLVVLSIKDLSYHNTSFEPQKDLNYFNNTLPNVYSNKVRNANNSLDNNFKHKGNKATVDASGKRKNVELADLLGQNINESNNFNVNKVEKEILTLPAFAFEKATINTFDAAFTSTMVTTTEFSLKRNITSTNTYIEVETTTIINFLNTDSTQETSKIVSNNSKFTPQTIVNLHHKNDQHQSHESLVGRSNRKQNRQRKMSSALTKSKNQNQITLDSSKHMYLLNNVKRKQSIILPNLHKESILKSIEGRSGGTVYGHRPSSYEESNNDKERLTNYSKSLTTISSSTRDSNIHLVKPEKFSEILPSTPLSSNSKIIEIKTKPNNKNKRYIPLTGENREEIQLEYLVGSFSLNASNEYIAEVNHFESTTTSAIQSPNFEDGVFRLNGFAGMLQMFLGVEKPIAVNMFNQSPSAEFINLLLALLVWCVRYPAVFWNTAKAFATIFSVQMIASAADIIFSFVGISNLYKLQIYSQDQPIKNPGLILNASVTLGLFLLSVILILSSSMVMYLYGYGRLSGKIRDRSIISLKSNESWIYFAHCASLCYVLSLSVVKAPLLNDLSVTYRNTLHCPTLMAAFVSVMHILLWIIIWLALTVKRKWSFKLPPLDAYAIIGKASTQPLLMHNRGSITNTITASLNNSSTMGGSSSYTNANIEQKFNSENSGNVVSNTSSSDVLNDATPEDVYWPKITPSSPKLKVTFNEVTSTSNDDDHHRLIDEHEQNDGKRNSSSGTSVCFTSIKGEVDDGEYATLRSGTPTIVGFSKVHIPTSGAKFLQIGECDGLPPPPINMISSTTITNHTTTVPITPGNNYAKCLDDNLSEEGKLSKCVQNDITYASTLDLEPPPLTKNISSHISKISNENHQQIPESKKCSTSPEHLISSLAHVKITSSFATTCLHRADSGAPQEALTPRSDTTSCTEITISPPERALSDSSSGVQSAEEREVEIVIKHRIACNPIAKIPPPPIQEEPYGRSTNMRMSSFAGGGNSNSSTLPLQRPLADQKFDYSQHCSTMPLPINGHNNYLQSTVYATSAHCMSQSQNSNANLNSFKTPLYANSGFAMLGHKASQLLNKDEKTLPPVPPPLNISHTSLTNYAHYSNPNIIRRQPSIKFAELPCSHQTISKIGYERALVNSTMLEDRDSANYSMISDQESLYATANSLH